ncbi:20S-pre-rRNA D-site endonuclease Nob1p [Monosporozyma unispora]|nr:Nin1 binding protein [Kazachstania unispora]
MSFAHVRALVLDATPLITQPYTHYQNFAEKFYTTPTIIQEIKDVQARKNLEIWQSVGNLHMIHPSEESIKRVSQFAKLTGDYSVLSANDIHILALAYQLEVQLNNGDWRLRKRPGDKLKEQAEEEAKKKEAKKEKAKAKKEEAAKKAEEPVVESTTEKEATVPTTETENKPKKKRRRGGKKQREKREARLAAGEVETETETKPETPVEAKKEPVAEPLKEEEPQTETAKPVKFEDFEEVTKSKNQDDSTELEEDYLEEDDDGDWITPDTLTETMLKDSGEDTVGSRGVEATEKQRKEALNLPKNQVALATGDFAIQNVALQLNMNLMNFNSGLRIKRLRNYMLRCHACFQIFPLPKDGKAKHFCPSCGGQGTLLRCAVSVDARTGEITPHLKANFQWNNRGNRYSMVSPLSKNSQKKYGKKGFSHRKQNQDIDLLREDQREYEQLMKQEDWTRRHNEKVMNNWIGGGSADNYISPFAITGLKHHSVRVGRGRHVNSARRKK